MHCLPLCPANARPRQPLEAKECPYGRRAYPSCGHSARFFAGFGASSKVLNARCNSLHEGLDAWFGSLDELVEAKLEGPRARAKVGSSSLRYEGRAVLILTSTSTDTGLVRSGLQETNGSRTARGRDCVAVSIRWRLVVSPQVDRLAIANRSPWNPAGISGSETKFRRCGVRGNEAERGTQVPIVRGSTRTSNRSLAAVSVTCRRNSVECAGPSAILGEFLPTKTTGTLRAGSRRDSCMAYTDKMLADDSAADRKGDPAAGSVDSDTEVQGEDCSEDPTFRDLAAEQSRPALLDSDSYQRPRAGALDRPFAAMRPDQTKVHDALEDRREIVGERVLREDVNTQSTALQECIDGQFAALREHFDDQMTSFREHFDAQVTALREHLDTQFTALREHVVAQFTDLREVMDARFDAQETRFDAQGTKLDAPRAEMTSEMAALRAEIKSLRRESRLTLALAVILVALRLF